MRTTYTPRRLCLRLTASLKIVADAENRDGSFACADSSAQCDLLPGESLLVTGCGQRLRLIAFDDAEQFHAIENKLMRR